MQQTASNRLSIIPVMLDQDVTLNCTSVLQYSGLPLPTEWNVNLDKVTALYLLKERLQDNVKPVVYLTIGIGKSNGKLRYWPVDLLCVFLLCN